MERGSRPKVLRHGLPDWTLSLPRAQSRVPTLELAMGQLDPPIPRTHIAYFSMEIALAPEMHTYSGGLGVLAGDTARSRAAGRSR